MSVTHMSDDQTMMASVVARGHEFFFQLQCDIS